MQSSPSSEPDSTSRPFWCRTLGRLALYRAQQLDEPIMLAGKPLALLANPALAPEQRADRDRFAELFCPLRRLPIPGIP